MPVERAAYAFDTDSESHKIPLLFIRFTILPQQAFCDKIYHWCMEMVLWRPGDNGMTIYEHSAAQYVNSE